MISRFVIPRISMWLWATLEGRNVKRLTKCQLLIVLGMVVLYATGTLAQEHTFQAIEYGEERFLTKEPVVTGFDGASAIVEFETMVPTPGACAYYGVIVPEEELGFPRYRKIAKESLPKGETSVTAHRIKMNISKLESIYYDTGLIENRGGVIVYRIEAFDPRLSATRFYDRRFRYKREGEPKTGTYSTCVTLTEGPFVDCVTHNSAVISWETDSACRGAVLIKRTEITDDADSSRHEVLITGLKPGTRYVYRVRYWTDAGISREYSFQTALAPGSERPFKFGFMSDSRRGVGGGERSLNGVNEKMLSEFITALYYKGAHFICFGGDLVNGYTSDMRDFESQLETWKRIVQPVAARIPIYKAIGNHEQVGNFYRVSDLIEKNEFYLLFTDREGEGSAEACFAREFVSPNGSVYGFGAPMPEARISGVGGAQTGPSYVENVYSFNYGNSHFVALNSNYWYTGKRYASGRKFAGKEAIIIALKHLGGNREGYIRPNQLKWLERDLQAAQNDEDIDWIFIYLHEPAFPNGGHLRDAMYWGTPGRGELGGYNDTDVPLGDVIDMRNRFWKVVAKYGKVIAVLCGDEHNYSRTRIDSSIHPDYLWPVWQIVSGGCGGPYYVQDKSVPWVKKVESFAPSKHYCFFTVDGDRVSMTVYSDTSEILDHVEDLSSIKQKPPGR